MGTWFKTSALGLFISKVVWENWVEVQSLAFLLMDRAQGGCLSLTRGWVAAHSQPGCGLLQSHQWPGAEF